MPRPKEQAKSYIHFVREPGKKGRKTAEWSVITLDDAADNIGTVKWFPAWRRYAFFPAANTLYEPKCLRDLANFCEAKTTERKAERRKERLAEDAAQEMPESWRMGQRIPAYHP